MRILFVTDLHGSRWKYERVLETAGSSGVDMVINGGDMFPHSRDLSAQSVFITGFLDEHLSRYDSAGILYLCYPGNDDLRVHDDLFEETCDKYGSVVYLAQRRFETQGFEFIGMNWVVDYPFRLKDRCRKDTDDYVFQPQLGSGLLSTPEGFEEVDDWFARAGTVPTIEEEMECLVRPNDMERAVYVIHMPPSGLGLDECANGVQVGSKSVLRFLRSHQPRLSLHGHIHESPGISGRWNARLGDTVCVQPGQLEDLAYVIGDLSTMALERVTESREP
ncbi:MAG: metallophosphoesterase [Candidatus Eisenbacteria sp.]|nr:metallophosphoesterase [Candidatus Eisenbacteria bacterium]